MRTDAQALALVLVLALAAGLAGASGCSGGDAARRPDGLDVSAFPPDLQRSYAVFAYRCSRCHSLARPLTAQVDDDEHWRRYVDRMRRQPASGISPRDAEIILQFLVYWTAHRRETRETSGGPPPEPPPPEISPPPELQDAGPPSAEPAGAPPQAREPASAPVPTLARATRGAR